VKDGTETDLDCGGACAPCALQKKCLVGADCQSMSCSGGICVAPTCMDNVENGNETDKDCGGSCSPCAVGKFCGVPSDCTSGVCTGGVCAIPICGDGVKNGTESDVDCGAACPQKCALGKKCGGSGDCVSGACTGGTCACPAKMVVAPIPGGGILCVDAYEVTYSDYLAFYNANPSLALQPAACTSWNQSYTPTGAWPPVPAALGNPVRYVNWCDAAAYCAFAGKHLCGATGGGGANDPAEFADPSKSEWFDACTAQGQNDYPYGDVFSSAACNGAPNLDVAAETSFASCLGGSPGLYHMSGNVAEWEDSCTGTTLQTDDCRVRGGSFQSGQTDLRCDADLLHPRDYTGPEVGFRCCL
jgi:hypothetical protein